MKKYIIAIDVDGTLRSYRSETKIIPVERIRTLAVTLATFKNVKVVVWSKRGAEYAKEVSQAIGLNFPCYEKGQIEVDIAIDDQHEFDMGKMNLIVNEREAVTPKDGATNTDQGSW